MWRTIYRLYREHTTPIEEMREQIKSSHIAFMLAKILETGFDSKKQKGYIEEQSVHLTDCYACSALCLIFTSPNITKSLSVRLAVDAVRQLIEQNTPYPSTYLAKLRRVILKSLLLIDLKQIILKRSFLKS
ncbi:MAG: hypothetical protein COU90_04585 [Candidatus Ryanbacteria bacterium CG10_big_fil_rev_8_21_14_0_10_43_42]|uniref:Uncharacterized protein n=1 Tax=Candidatus Ryanbacteria bacterium CG10_big_fil_rev_8_21_14_0_10_43_42 TaxID=1974864 RepID=A0A2M8KW09_9BACT|nr:MAG: hypothetical protein COU90_04585 [Candidatus Ryanbacteria bacterium CG10_big_fil_rev_8_21_14_0_10_43_42]